MAQNESQNPEITLLLHKMGEGDRSAAGDLLPLVYGELRRLAHTRMGKLPAGQTLQATALVHEAYLALVGEDDPGWLSRGHFFGAAAQAMRDLLVEQFRRKSRQKHGGELRRVDTDGQEFEDVLSRIALPDLDMIALDQALSSFQEEYPDRAEVVLLHYFAGLTHREIAEVRNVSTRTVTRDWRFARVWLHQRMEG